MRKRRIDSGATTVEAAIGIGIFFIFLLLALELVIGHMAWISLQRALSEAHRTFAISSQGDRSLAHLRTLVGQQADRFGLNRSLIVLKACQVEPSLTVPDFKNSMESCPAAKQTDAALRAERQFIAISALYPFPFSRFFSNLRIAAQSIKRNERNQ